MKFFDPRCEEKWNSITLKEEYPEIIGEKNGAVRVYFATEQFLHEIKHRWFLGFPRAKIEPIYMLLKTTPFWGEAHIAEDENFWIWREAVLTSTITTEIPLEKLNAVLKSRIIRANECLQTLQRWAKPNIL